MAALRHTLEIFVFILLFSFIIGLVFEAFGEEPIAAALTEAGVRVFRHTAREDHPRGIFCAIGRCTDCAMTVNGVPGVRTCITRVEEGMRVETQHGLGKWGDPHA